MNQSQSANLQRSEADSEKDFDIVGLLVIVAKNKKLIGSVALAAALVSAAVGFVMPDQFKATTRLLPPQQTQSSAAALLSQLGGVAGAAVGGAGGLKNPNDMYVGMLQSRTIADRIIAQFNLKKVYGTTSQDRARKELEDRTSIMAGKDGLIVIEVEDENKKLVAPLANAYVSEMFQLMKTLAVTDAGQRRIFYEGQLQATKDKLAKAEYDLKQAMATRGVISVDTETRATLETMAHLKAQISAKEIQLSAMRAFVTETNPEYQRSHEELNGLRSELSKLENGTGASTEKEQKSGGLENIKLLRELKYQQMLYEVLAKQYEVARIDEAKDPSVIQVLDVAIEPENKSKPRPKIIVLIATLVGLLVGIAIAFLREAHLRSLQRPEGAAQWAELKRYLGFGNGKTQ